METKQKSALEIAMEGAGLIPRYEIGGTLTDGRGTTWPILDVDRSKPNLLKITAVDAGEWVWADFFAYTPPQKAITITPGDALWKALEEIEAGRADKRTMMAIEAAFTAAKGGAK